MTGVQTCALPISLPRIQPNPQTCPIPRRLFLGPLAHAPHALRLRFGQCRCSCAIVRAPRCCPGLRLRPGSRPRPSGCSIRAAPTRHLLGFEPKWLPVSHTPHGFRLRSNQVLLTRQAISLRSMTRCSSPRSSLPSLRTWSSLRESSSLRSRLPSPPLFGHKPRPTLRTRLNTRSTPQPWLRFEVKPLSGADPPALPDLEASFFWIQTNREKQSDQFWPGDFGWNEERDLGLAGDGGIG